MKIWRVLNLRIGLWKYLVNFKFGDLTIAHACVRIPHIIINIQIFKKLLIFFLIRQFAKLKTSPQFPAIQYSISFQHHNFYAHPLSFLLISLTPSPLPCPPLPSFLLSPPSSSPTPHSAVEQPRRHSPARETHPRGRWRRRCRRGQCCDCGWGGRGRRALVTSLGGVGGD